MATQRDIKRRNLWLDEDQGKGLKERTFGFIGVYGTDDDYCGMFFTWPRGSAEIRTVAEREQVIDSLEYDETTQHHAHIPHAWCRQKLESYLRKTFDLRRKD
jgi:hypothetical protein